MKPIFPSLLYSQVTKFWPVVVSEHGMWNFCEESLMKMSLSFFFPFLLFGDWNATVIAESRAAILEYNVESAYWEGQSSKIWKDLGC